MRRASTFLLVLSLLAVVGPFAASATSAATVNPCTTSEMNVISYNVSVATGSVGDLFWVADIGSKACSVHGYPRASYLGNYGSVQSKKPAEPLAVAETDRMRRFDVAGVAKGRALPTVTLSPGGATASFWIFGTDMPHRLADGRQSRCIVSYEMSVSLTKGPSTIVVTPARTGNFDFCGSVTIFPIVAGDTGSDPAYPLDRTFAPTPP